MGFRPFVWRLAKDAGLRGHVLNDGEGVSIEVWGTEGELGAFLATLTQDAPPLARVESVSWDAINTPPPYDDFRITPSDHGVVSTEVAPDAATCPDCLAEILDPADRRFSYPFTNCTHCGPRLSIVRGIPYDRASTSMAAFKMCEQCRQEYDNPANRRFHAQPNACPACGPQVWLEDAEGPVACADPIAETARRLQAGEIIAVKGIGGFHLACDATSATVVAALRRSKHRPSKPLAVMATDLAEIRRFCRVTREAAELLRSSAAPIVVLETLPGSALPGIAPGQSRTGFMLPYSPLHHLLMTRLDRPVVMTSGNISDEPQVTDNDKAREALAALADAWLLHDREIVNRLDDSVLRIDAHGPQVIRRGRGMAPAPLRLADSFASAPPILAMGAEIKSTFTLLEDGRAVPSQHIGDLKNATTYLDYREKIALYRNLFRFDPAIIAVDRHPDYLSTQWGRRLAAETGAQIVEVQHHHAHLASCLAEHRIAPDADQTVGIVLDGLGFGTDGTIWGGEVLVGGYSGFERRAHFDPVAMPGAEQAAREPWRNTVAHLMAAFGPDWMTRLEATELGARLSDKPLELIEKMISRGVNAPRSSSAGRLFDAVAAALGIAFDRQHYEGQAAMELEALAQSLRTTDRGYPVEIADHRGVRLLSWEPLWSELLLDLKAGIAPAIIAARFHRGLAEGLAITASSIARETGLTRIALTGGVMQNALLSNALHRDLTSRGFDVLTHAQIPANDGGISLGQAAVAAAALSS